MDKLDRINKKMKDMIVERLSLEIEASAALAALEVSSEAVDNMKLRIEQEQSRLRGLRNELDAAEAALSEAKTERDELKSRSA